MNESLNATAPVAFHVKSLVAQATGTDYNLLVFVLTLLGSIVGLAVILVVLAVILVKLSNQSADKRAAAARSNLPSLRSKEVQDNVTVVPTKEVTRHV